MKSRLWSVFLAVSLLFLASCGHKETVGDNPAATEPSQIEATEPAEQTEPTEQTVVTEQTEQAETTEPALVLDYSSAEALKRPEHAWLYYSGEGSETAPAPTLKSETTLYIGDGYSIYIIDEGWTYQADTMGGRHVDIWKNAQNENAEMRIVKMGSVDDKQVWDKAEDWVRAQYPEYEFEACPCGALDNSGDDIWINAEFQRLGDCVYATIYIFETKFYERYAYPMKTMLRTIRPFFYFPTAKELERPEHTQLTCPACGEETALEASLYVGNSYSIYVPDEAWTKQTGIMQWETVGAWKSTLYEGVELRIESGKQSSDSAREANPGYVITEKEYGGMTGENAEGFRMDVIWTSDKIDRKDVEYTIYKVYPAADTEESERAKAMLDAMADTFKPFINKVTYNLMH